jgi:hypothetical protein
VEACEIACCADDQEEEEEMIEETSIAKKVSCGLQFS